MGISKTDACKKSHNRFMLQRVSWRQLTVNLMRTKEKDIWNYSMNHSVKNDDRMQREEQDTTERMDPEEMIKNEKNISYSAIYFLLKINFFLNSDHK